MRLVALLLLAGCPAEPGDDYPIAPGGYGPGGNSGPRDAAAGDGDGGTTLSGRVCVVGDLRDLDTCAVTGAAGLAVFLGSSTAITAEDGRFTIVAPAGSNLTWRVTGPALVSSVMRFGTSRKIPAVTTATFGEVMGGSGVVLSQDQGSIIARVVQGVTPVAGATAIAEPEPQYDPYYDGNDPKAWDQDSTGPAGLVWLTGAPIGTATVRVTRAGGGSVVETHLVEDQAITFATVEIP